MKEIFLGDVIRQRRLELGLTQEELCEGICEPMTISRFEIGTVSEHSSSGWDCQTTGFTDC